MLSYHSTPEIQFIALLEQTKLAASNTPGGGKKMGLCQNCNKEATSPQLQRVTFGNPYYILIREEEVITPKMAPLSNTDK